MLVTKCIRHVRVGRVGCVEFKIVFYARYYDHRYCYVLPLTSLFLYLTIFGPSIFTIDFLLDPSFVIFWLDNRFISYFDFGSLFPEFSYCGFRFFQRSSCFFYCVFRKRVISGAVFLLCIFFLSFFLTKHDYSFQLRNIHSLTVAKSSHYQQLLDRHALTLK